ncbi:MAG: 6-phosphogluconolactonase [Nitrospiraceae bacterium]
MNGAADYAIVDMTTQPEVLIYRDGQEWVHGACDLLRRTSEESIHSRGRVLIALSGGSTPRTLYQAMTSSEWKQRFDWDRMVFLFGDERCVPPDHPESNFGTAQAALFGPLRIKADRIHRMKGEAADPAVAAQDYEQTIRQLTDCSAPAIPRLDIVLLGLGDDGHTASLFPGTTALSDQGHLVAVSQSPKGISRRLTLTLGVINRATVVLFLVAGPGKASMVRAILEPHNQAERGLPAALVQPVPGRLIWLLDQSAGAALMVRQTGKR